MALFLLPATMAENIIVSGIVADEYGQTNVPWVAGADICIYCHRVDGTGVALQEVHPGADGFYLINVSMDYATEVCVSPTFQVCANRNPCSPNIYNINDTTQDFLISEDFTVPEFGLVAGVLAFAGAIGAFLFVRKR